MYPVLSSHITVDTVTPSIFSKIWTKMHNWGNVEYALSASNNALFHGR